GQRLPRRPSLPPALRQTHRHHASRRDHAMNTTPTHLRLRRGTVLIAAMFITAMLAGLVLVLCRSMRVEAIASANEAAAIQASSIARGAEQYVIGLLAYEKDAVRELPENTFAAVPVGDGFFWIARPDYSD